MRGIKLVLFMCMCKWYTTWNPVPWCVPILFFLLWSVGLSWVFGNGTEQPISLKLSYIYKEQYMDWMGIWCGLYMKILKKSYIYVVQIKSLSQAKKVIHLCGDIICTKQEKLCWLWWQWQLLQLQLRGCLVLKAKLYTMSRKKES